MTITPALIPFPSSDVSSLGCWLLFGGTITGGGPDERVVFINLPHDGGMDDRYFNNVVLTVDEAGDFTTSTVLVSEYYITDDTYIPELASSSSLAGRKILPIPTDSINSGFYLIDDTNSPLTLRFADSTFSFLSGTGKGANVVINLIGDEGEEGGDEGEEGGDEGEEGLLVVAWITNGVSSHAGLLSYPNEDGDLQVIDASTGTLLPAGYTLSEYTDAGQVGTHNVVYFSRRNTGSTNEIVLHRSVCNALYTGIEVYGAYTLNEPDGYNVALSGDPEGVGFFLQYHVGGVLRTVYGELDGASGLVLSDTFTYGSSSDVKSGLVYIPGASRFVSIVPKPGSIDIVLGTVSNFSISYELIDSIAVNCVDQPSVSIDESGNVIVGIFGDGGTTCPVAGAPYMFIVAVDTTPVADLFWTNHVLQYEIG